MSDLRDLLKSQTAAATTGAQLNTVGGRVFLDGSARSSMNDLQAIGEVWRVVHAPTFGAPIPATDTTTSYTMTGDSTESVLDPSNGVVQVVAVDVTNGGGATPLVVELSVNGVLISSEALSIDPLGRKAFQLTSPLFIGPSTPLQAKVTQGTATDATVTIAHVTVAF